MGISLGAGYESARGYPILTPVCVALDAPNDDANIIYSINFYTLCDAR